jgi:alpha-D-xyloside xylohydrolase
MPWGPKVQYSEQSNWDNLEIRIYAGADGTFTRYEDERDNYNYEQGHFTEIPFSWNDKTKTLTIGARSGAFDGMLKNRTFRIVLVDAEKHMGLGIQQSQRFSKEVKYTGSEVNVKIDNDHTTSEDVTTIQSIQATPSNVNLYLGQSQTFAVKAKLADGSSKFITLDAVYESSDTLVTTVRDGIIHAGLKEGHADINVTYTDGLGTTHQTTIGVDASVPTNLYNWKAYDWYKNRVADRLGASDIAYSSKDNTITITKTGAQNIALKYSDKKYMEPGSKYLVAVATDVSKNKDDSQLWYINGNWVNIVNPTDVRTLKDGRIMIAWTIDESTGYQLTGETIFGMTSTNAQGRSVISYVGFTSDLKKLQQELNVAVGIAPITNNQHTMHSIYAINGTPRTHLSTDINIITNGSKTVKLLKK